MAGRKFVVTARGKKLDMNALKAASRSVIPVRNFRSASTKSVVVSKAKTQTASVRVPKVNGVRPAPRVAGAINNPPIDRQKAWGVGLVPVKPLIQIPSHPVVEETKEPAMHEAKKPAKVTKQIEKENTES